MGKCKVILSLQIQERFVDTRWQKALVAPVGVILIRQLALCMTVLECGPRFPVSLSL